MSPLVSTGLRPGLGLGSSVTPAPQDPVVSPVDTASRSQTASPILSRDAHLWPEGSGGPGPQSVPRGWAQDTQGSRATRSGLSWTARGASVPGSGRGEHGGQLTGALGEPTRPPLLSHEMTGVLALVGLSQDRKRDPERHFQSKKRRSRKPGHFGSGDGGAPWE